jgi:hypothetical protein
MAKARAEKPRFRLMERLFRLVWVAFPLYVGFQVWQVLTLPNKLANLDPKLAACMQQLPLVPHFSLGGKVVYWIAFTMEMSVYFALLLLAHRVLARAARGQIFIPELASTLKTIALIITLLPLFDLVLQNALLAILAGLGDMPFYSPSFDFDVTIFGVGLLMLTISSAMREAVRLREDADLTI